MARPLIGLAGPAGSGKNTVANLMGWVQRAFAEPIYQAALALNPIAGEFTTCLDVLGQTVSLGDRTLLRLDVLVARYGWERAKREFPEVRRVLQVIGTEAGRDIHGPRCWVDLADFGLAEPGVVFTDLRARVEAAAVRKHGGIVVWVARGGPLNDHPTENAINSMDCEYYLDNRGSLAELPGRVQTMMETLGFAPAPRRVA